MLEISKNFARNLFFSERLTRAMNQILRYPLRIIEASMGYGKTTVVREFVSNSDIYPLWQRINSDSQTSVWIDLLKNQKAVSILHLQA